MWVLLDTKDWRWLHPSSSQAGVQASLHTAGWYQSGESKHFIIFSWQAFVSWLLYFFKFVSPTIAFGLELICSIIALMPSMPNLQSDSRNIFNSNPSAFPPVCLPTLLYEKKSLQCLESVPGKGQTVHWEKKMSQSAQGRRQALFNLCLTLSTVSWLWETWAQAESVSLRVE